MIHFLSKTKPEARKGTAVVRLDVNAADAWRLESSVPTIRFLIKSGARVLIVSHRGRPEGVRLVKGFPRGFDKSLSLCRDARILSRLIKKSVAFIPHFNFKVIQALVRRSSPGSVFLLENLRFLEGEGKNSRELARTLASLGTFYVNDAFAVSHRQTASTAVVTHYMPSYAGFSLEEELKRLGGVMRDPRHPLVMVFGGAKAADKLAVLKNFRKKADVFIVAGVLSNTIIRQMGINIGKSRYDTLPRKDVESIMKYKNLILPLDYRVRDDKIMDIGPKTEQLIRTIIAKARTIIWNGPLGIVEESFSSGTLALLRAIHKNHKAFSVAGGGETVTFLRKRRWERKFSFVSTGGGAMLEFLAGKKLPGIEALKRSSR